jgi:hypothetical protein
MDEITKTRRRRRRWLIGLVVAAIYLAAYLALSRRGYLEADRYDLRGFYYLPPENSARWRYLNYGCAYLFLPLNKFDCWLGTGRPPAAEPLWGLSR